MKTEDKIFVGKLKARSYKLKASGGFALLELLVAVVLFGIITAFVLFSYHKVSEQLFMTTLAFETAFTLRQAQSYGISVRQFGADSGATFEAAYGVHFNATVSDRFIFFADSDKNGRYTTGGDDSNGCIRVPTSECVDVYRIGRSNRIEKFCAARATNDGDECSTGTPTALLNLDVMFLRPNPDSIFYTDHSISGTTYKSATIHLISPNNLKRRVEVWNTGQISIKSS